MKGKGKGKVCGMVGCSNSVEEYYFYCDKCTAEMYEENKNRKQALEILDKLGIDEYDFEFLIEYYTKRR